MICLQLHHDIVFITLLTKLIIIFSVIHISNFLHL